MKTITGLFDDYEDASVAFGDLERIGVSRSDISIVASNSTGWYHEDGKDDGSEAAEGAAGGARIGAVVGGLGLMAILGVGPVVAAGWLAAAAVGALGCTVVGGATGGIVGTRTNSGIADDDAHVYAEGLRRGGTLLTAKVSDERVKTVNRL